MWLINVDTFELKEFVGNYVPAYAILSHTWDDDEVSFQDMKDLEVAMRKKGFRKIQFCCSQARVDGWDWAWVDTCCIDKSSRYDWTQGHKADGLCVVNRFSSAELSEAINSMFRWYERSMICYVYLGDTNSSSKGQLRKCRWFSRGWTLQELLAPFEVVFYSRTWDYIGTKLDLKDTIESITGIYGLVLCHELSISKVSVATRLQWASQRKTTRVEDLSYSLLGIFGVNMPLLYGEGHKAFHRLQEHIMRSTQDHTIFLWNYDPECNLSDPRNSAEAFYWEPFDMLAKSPFYFHETHVSIPTTTHHFPDTEFTISERGLRISLPLLKVDRTHIHKFPGLGSLMDANKNVYLAALNCLVKSDLNDDSTTTTSSPDSQSRSPVELLAGQLSPQKASAEADSKVIAIVLQQGSKKHVSHYTRYGPWFYVLNMEECSIWDYQTCFISNGPPTADSRPDLLPLILKANDLDYIETKASVACVECQSTEECEEEVEVYDITYDLKSKNGPRLSFQLRLLGRNVSGIICGIAASTPDQIHQCYFHPQSSVGDEGSRETYTVVPDRQGPVFKRRQLLDGGLEADLTVVRKSLFPLDFYTPYLKITKSSIST